MKCNSYLNLYCCFLCLGLFFISGIKKTYIFIESMYKVPWSNADTKVNNTEKIHCDSPQYFSIDKKLTSTSLRAVILSSSNRVSTMLDIYYIILFVSRHLEHTTICFFFLLFSFPMNKNGFKLSWVQFYYLQICN